MRVPAAFVPVFERAQDYVVRYFEQRRFDPTEATIEIFGRYVLVRAASMSVEFFEQIARLYEDQGEEEASTVARSLLFDVAHATGAGDARNLHDLFPELADPIERLSAGPVHLAHAGWAFGGHLTRGVARSTQSYEPVSRSPYRAVNSSGILRR